MQATDVHMLNKSNKEDSKHYTKMNMHAEVYRLSDRARPRSLIEEYVVLGGNTNPKSTWLASRRFIAFTFLVCFIIFMIFSAPSALCAISAVLSILLFTPDIASFFIRRRCALDAGMSESRAFSFSFRNEILNRHYDSEGQICDR